MAAAGRGRAWPSAASGGGGRRRGRAVWRRTWRGGDWGCVCGAGAGAGCGVRCAVCRSDRCRGRIAPRGRRENARCGGPGNCRCRFTGHHSAVCSPAKKKDSSTLDIRDTPPIVEFVHSTQQCKIVAFFCSGLWSPKLGQLEGH